MVSIPKIGLRPYSVLEEGLDEYLQYNFARIQNVFDVLKDSVGGSLSITGAATFATGLVVVNQAVACLAAPPVAGACFVTTSPAAGGSLTVTVYTSAFAVSVTPILIRWIALGELVLS